MRAILTYHSIDGSGSPISVSLSAFDAHLAWFVSGRVRVLDLDALLAHPDDREDAVSIAFDDGFLNVRGVVDRLGAAGLSSAIFVVTDHVGGTNAWGGRASPKVPTLPLMTWDDLGDVSTRGAYIGAHSRHHPSFTAISETQLDDELAGSHQAILSRLGVSTEHLAYPYGDVDDTVAERAGRYFRFGHTTDFRLLRARDDVMRLPRLDMYYFQSRGALEAWGTGAFTRLVAWCRARRAIRRRVIR